VSAPGPRDAQVTVVGGGAVGAAVTYLLAREGWTDVQLLERGDLCAATSSQAAGMVGQARPTADRTRLAMAAAELYRTLPAVTGCTADYRQSGAVRLALSDRSREELQQIAATAEHVGLPVEFVDHRRLRDLVPVLDDVSAVRAALWSPTCGYLQPNSLVEAYTRAARDLGATVTTHCAVTGVDVRAGAVHGVRTELGDVRSETVVVAAGPWSTAVVRTAGLDLPLVPVRHSYFVTEPAGWDADLPCLRIPEVQVYARGESGRLLCGGFERRATSLDPRSVETSSPLVATADWDVLGSFATGLARFAPPVSGLGVGATFQGWPTFTPDGRFVVGPVTGLPGLVMAAGCNAHGVSGSAGLAMHLVESLRPDPSPYVRSLSPDRFVPRTWSWEDARSRAQSVYEHYYPMPDEVVVRSEA
jgi:glycine/D-amino acid oxidase-like deaminating enzyme